MLQQAHQAITILENAGFEARIAGGAVRDYLLGKDPKDIDIATTGKPVDVIMAFEALGYTVVPTGLQHGTVTVVIGKDAFEVTTLRIDKATDGRHAEVEFVEDWKLDAARRDFTFNAMFMDKDGKIYDYFGGESDLKNCVVRFVGDAQARIEEDYLRIMRYFRFLGRMKTVVWDDTTTENLEIIRKLAFGLKNISGERIWAELQKILSQDKAFTIVRLMVNTIGPVLDIDPGFYPQVKDFNHEYLWLLKLIALYNHDERVLDIMKNRFHAASAELDFVRIYFMLNHDRTTNFQIISECQKSDYHKLCVTDLVRWKQAKNWQNLNAFFERDSAFVWPITAEHLMAEGYVPGPDLGKELKRRRSAWLDSIINL
jgi:tRNA nucleotidyltransferase/poly(A) polymerase